MPVRMTANVVAFSNNTINDVWILLRVLAEHKEGGAGATPPK
jgi:hypothetical protein